MQEFIFGANCTSVYEAYSATFAKSLSSTDYAASSLTSTEPEKDLLVYVI